jgi:hypothetical protein
MLVEEVGPFRDRFELDFSDKRGTLCNFFLLAAPNGLGKTTLIRVFVGLLEILDRESQLPILAEFEEFMGLSGRAQLDVRLELSASGARESVILSLWTGADRPVQYLGEKELEQGNATRWLHIGAPSPDRGRRYDDESGRILDAIAPYIGKAMPSALFEQSIPAPTALYFPAGRSVSRPPRRHRPVIAQPDGIYYRPVQVFDQDGATWENSLDNLLTWYSWLEDGRYELIQELTDKHIFESTPKRLAPVNRALMQAEVSSASGFYRIDRLSHGERALMQLFVRTASHMAGSTLLVIDEMDLHLHPNWRIRLMRSLKGLVKQYPGLWIMASTHLPELIEEFAFEQEEQGLIKAGHIISREEL